MCVSEDQSGNTMFSIMLKVFGELPGIGRHPYRNIHSNTTHPCTGEDVPHTLVDRLLARSQHP